VAQGATSKSIHLIALLAVIVVSTFAMPARADDRARMKDPFEITADRIDYDGRRELYVATGRVRVLQTDRTLHANWVAFSTKTRIGVAEGDVELIDGVDTLNSAFMVFDVDSLRGMLYQGGFDAGSQGFKIRAKEMIRTGQDTFEMRDGIFSSCRCEEGETLPWQIHAGKAEVEVGGYGTVTNARFEVLGIPTLWVPWAFFPVKSDRATGLLLPQIELGGRGGYGLGLPFFWAAHPQVNVTVTPRVYSERGFKGDVELEYVYGERSRGKVFFSGLRDRNREPKSAINRGRWAVRSDTDHELPSEWRWQTDLNLASDNFYPDDFSELRRYRAFRYLESTTSLNRDFGASGGIGAMVGARWADDIHGFNVRRAPPVTRTIFHDSDDFILQRMGEGRLDVQPGTFLAPLGIEPRFDSEVIHFRSRRKHEDIFEDQANASFQQNDGRYYDIGVDGAADPPPPPPPGQSPTPRNGQDDGVFQPGEAVAERGVRIVMHPRIARRFRLGDWAEFEPEVGWHQTLYKTDRREFAERGLVTARAEIRSRFARRFDYKKTGELRHVLEPRLSWAYVSARQQDENPLFVPRAVVAQSRLRSLSLENLTRDPSDRIRRANRIVLGLGQRLYTRGSSRAAFSMNLDLVTAIDWDFVEESLGGIHVDARMMGAGPLGARLVGTIDPEAGALDEAGVELSFRKRFKSPWLRQLRVTSGYRYRRRLPLVLEVDRGILQVGQIDTVNQINLLTSFEFTARWRLRFSTIYKLAEENEFIRNEGTLEYVSKCKCWAAGATVATDQRNGIGGGLNIRFMGLGDGSGNLFDRGIGSGLSF